MIDLETKTKTDDKANPKAEPGDSVNDAVDLGKTSSKEKDASHYWRVNQALDAYLVEGLAARDPLIGFLWALGVTEKLKRHAVADLEPPIDGRSVGKALKEFKKSGEATIEKAAKKIAAVKGFLDGDAEPEEKTQKSVIEAIGRFKTGENGWKIFLGDVFSDALLKKTGTLSAVETKGRMPTDTTGGPKMPPHVSHRTPKIDPVRRELLIQYILNPETLGPDGKALVNELLAEDAELRKMYVELEERVKKAEAKPLPVKLRRLIKLPSPSIE